MSSYLFKLLFYVSFIRGIIWIDVLIQELSKAFNKYSISLLNSRS